MGTSRPNEPGIGKKVFFTVLLIGLSPFLIIAVLFYLVWGIILCMAIWLSWRKPPVLFVYSESPIWKDYMEREIIPHIKDFAVILNWSERKNWNNSLSVWAFRYFGGNRNFNPITIVFRPWRFVKAYRFFEAFQKFKHGNTTEVEKIKNDMFENLGIEKHKA
jgi:hypothetical protein